MPRLDRVGTHQTVIATFDGFTQVVYHSTPVVKFSASTIVLDSGGWQSATSKTRMNQAANQFGLGYNVFQKDWDWFVELDWITLAQREAAKNGEDMSPRVYPFRDGMRIDRATGIVTYPEGSV